MEMIATPFDPLFWQLSLTGFVVGVLVGLTGVGGGSLTTPTLIAVFGLPPHIAVGTDLLFAAITKTFAAWRHHALGTVSWDIVGWLAAGSVPGALLTLVFLWTFGSDAPGVQQILRYMLAAALGMTALSLLFFTQLRSVTSDLTAANPAARPGPTVAFGLVVGVLVTVTSVGAGALGVAVLALLYPVLSARRIVGTDIAHAIPLALVGGLGHLWLGHVDFSLLLALLVGSIPGIALGTRLVGLPPERVLRTILATVLTLAAVRLSLK